MKKTAVLVLTLAIVIFSGCSESQTATQLRLEKAEIVKEFKSEKAKLQEKIDSLSGKITALEDKIEQQKGTIEGYNRIIFDLIPENEKLKKENKQLKEKLQPSQDACVNEGTGAEKKVPKEKLEELKALQKKAKQQRGEDD